MLHNITLITLIHLMIFTLIFKTQLVSLLKVNGKKYC